MCCNGEKWEAIELLLLPLWGCWWKECREVDVRFSWAAVAVGDARLKRWPEVMLIVSRLRSGLLGTGRGAGKHLQDPEWLRRLLGNPQHFKPVWGLLPDSQSMEQGSRGGFEHAVPSCDGTSHSRQRVFRCAQSGWFFNECSIVVPLREFLEDLGNETPSHCPSDGWQLFLEINGDEEGNCSLPPAFGSGSSGSSGELTDSIAVS